MFSIEFISAWQKLWHITLICKVLPFDMWIADTEGIQGTRWTTSTGIYQAKSSNHELALIKSCNIFSFRAKIKGIKSKFTGNPDSTRYLAKSKPLRQKQSK